MPSAQSGACPSADARLNRAIRLSAFFIPSPGIPWGGCRLFPGCPRASPYLHVRLTSLACQADVLRSGTAPFLPLPSWADAGSQRRASRPQRRICRPAAARLQICIRAAAFPYPRGCKFVSARLQKTTRAGTGFHPGRYVPASVRVRLCIRADASLHPCGCDSASGQIRPSVRADATFHPGRYDPASVQVRFYSPSDTRKHPQGCLGASLRV